MQKRMQFWLGITQPPGMVCMKGRGTALRPRADLGARERYMGPGAPTSPGVSHLPVPQVFLFPRQQALPWVTGAGCGEWGWMDRGGWGGGWRHHGPEAVLWWWHLLCSAVSSPWLSPLPLQGLSPGQGWGHGPRGAALQWRQTFRLGPWQQEPAGLVAAAGESGAALGNWVPARQFGWAGEKGDGSKAAFAAEWVS